MNFKSGPVALAASRVFPASLALMVVIGFGSILMAATGNTTIQLAVPDHLRGRVMSVYTTVFSASIPIGGLAMGAVASAFGVPVAIALGGALSVVIGLGALAWGRGGAFDALPGGGPGVAQGSTAPNTSAAFNPPNPNEVESTRR